jgi:hypothetical protein
MALALDGVAQTGTASTTASISSNANAFSTSVNGSIICAFTHAEWLNAAGAAGTVGSVTGGGLTWTRRSNVASMHTIGAPITWNVAELWWAFCPTVLNNVTITANYNLPGANNFDNATLLVFAVTGFVGSSYQTNPWDGNASLPKTNSSTSSSAPTTTGISTTSANAMLLGLVGSPDTAVQGSGAVNTNFTFITNVSAIGGSNESQAAAEFEVVSSTQSGISIGWTTAQVGWIMLSDALAQGAPDTLSGTNRLRM